MILWAIKKEKKKKERMVFREISGVVLDTVQWKHHTNHWPQEIKLCVAIDLKPATRSTSKQKSLSTCNSSTDSQPFMQHCDVWFIKMTLRAVEN